MQKRYLIMPGILIAVLIAAAVIMVTGPSTHDTPDPSLHPAVSPTPLPIGEIPFGDRLNSTNLLLCEPVGGFRGGDIWLTGPDTVSWDYVFYSRDYGPGNVTLTVSEAGRPLATTPVPMAPGISARMEPARFNVQPGTETVSRLIVTVSPEGYSHDPVRRTFLVHASVEGEKDAIADDWVSLPMADRPTTWLDYRTTGEISEREITVRRGEEWAGNLTVQLGERGTGPVHVLFKALDCMTMESSSTGNPQPLPAGWPLISVYPAQFLGRSFGSYILPLSISAAEGPVPGTYCFDTVIEAPNGQTSFSSKITVVP